ncbi:Aste57867_673 [Aphanomyces stellatus]|uniref:Aste57867_673 protein n=1 Tax=Aphanomyces stellatus TaxID=120398 RepID=A0A485K4D7_9STRA|nr:hypothetical protein As57867_000672 [Aphanomyces stellatus]VFT77898.1 Aste57867_673 [Aphanomyces stellatus]
MAFREYLLAVILLVCMMVHCIHAGSSFVFEINDRDEDCYMEDVASRSIKSDIFLHFEILDPEVYDGLHTRVVSPTGLPVASWNHTKGNHTSLQVRESGLYSICFTRAAGSSSRLSILYVFDFVSYGTRTLTRYPTSVTFIQEETPTVTNYTNLVLTTERGTPTHMGFVEYSFAGVSKSSLHENTRVLITFSVDHASKPGIEVTLAPIVGGLKHPTTWTNMRVHLENFHDHAKRAKHATTGGSIYFDITDDVAAAMGVQEYPTIAFSVQVAEDGVVRLAGNSKALRDHWPLVTFEDMGINVVQEIGKFRYSVWDLKGELVSIIQQERISRNAAESIFSRLVFSTIATNVLLLGLAVAQVLYVRTLLTPSRGY